MPLATPTRPGVPFVRELAGFADADAVVLPDRTVSYGELACLVDAAAADLGSGRRLVLVAAGNELAPLLVYLAALAAGHVVLLVPGDRPAAVAAHIAGYDPDVTYLRRDGVWVLETRHEEPAHDLHPELALLLPTSGSTASPKLVRLSHENLQSNAEAIATSLGITPADRAVTTLPFSYCYGLSVVHSHLARGAALVLTDLSVVDECFWQLLRQSRATTLAGVPYTFDLLDRVAFTEMELPHLRCVTQAGGPLAADRVRAYAEAGRRSGWDFVVMYGQTEATARMAYLPPDLALQHPDAVGISVPGGSLELAPVEGADPGVGELVYSGPNVMLGYAESPADLRLGRTVDALRTGDLGRREADGVYRVVGRTARFAKVFGQRIDLQHLELRLAGQGLRTACVDGGGRLVVAVEGATEPARLARSVAADCSLPHRAVQVVSYDVLPRLPSGKVDLLAIRSVARPADRPTSPAPGSVGLQALFAEALDRPDATEDSTFVSLGGDSLSYVELSVRLEGTLGHLPRSWHTRSIGELTAAVDPTPRRAGRRLETSVALRAVAILLIVGSHAGLFDLSGGAHVLLGVAGFNVARFCLGTVTRHERLRQLGRSGARIVVPGVAFIATAALLTGEYGPATVLMTNSILGTEGWSSAWHFWFLEAVVHLLLIVMALVAVPAVDRCERRFPFGFPVALLGLGLLARHGAVLALGADAIHTAAGVLWVFAFGWAAARARSAGQRLGLAVLLVAATPGYFTDPRRAVFMVCGLLVLLYLPDLRSTALTSRVAGVLAASSLYVYLTHWLVYPHLEQRSPILATAASFAVGFAYWQLVSRASRLRRASRPPTREPSRTGVPMRRRSAVIALLVALSTVAACSSGGSSGSQDADGLVVYSGRNEKLIEPLLEMFTEATGVDVSVKYGGSAELAAQLLEEGVKTPAGVFLSQDAGALGALQEAGRLDPLPQPQLDKVDPEFRSRTGRWVGVSGRARVLVYNSEQVPAGSLPDSVFDLTDPSYRGKIGLAPTNASFQAFVTGMRVTAGEARTKQFLTDLKANAPQTYEGNVLVVDAVNRGEVAVGLVNHYYLYERAEEVGGLDKLTAKNHFFPNGDPGALVNVAGVGVLAGRADDRTTQLVDFLLSPAAQKYFAEQTHEYPLTAGVPADPGLPPLAGIENPRIDLSELDSLDRTLALLDEVGLT